MAFVSAGEEEAQPHQGARQEEEADAGRERRRRPNEGAAALADETRSLRAVHAEAQVQAFGVMELYIGFPDCLSPKNALPKIIKYYRKSVG